MTNEFKDYYRILGVTYNASLENIMKAAKRELEYAYGSRRDDINKAYYVLSDYNRRNDYDSEFMSRMNIDQATFKNSQRYFEIENLNSISASYDGVSESSEKEINDEFKPTEVQEKEIKIEEAKEEKEVTEEPKLEENSNNAVEPINYKYIPVKRPEKIKEEPKKIDNTIVQNNDLNKKVINGMILAGGVAAGALIIGGVPGVIIGAVAGEAIGNFYKKHAGKIKLEKQSKPREIKKVNTEETRFIDQASEKLENEIYDLLSRPNNNYELEIACRKYENTIDLLKKRIEFKSNEITKSGYSVMKRLEIIALERKLSSVTKTYEQLTTKISKVKDSRLNTLNRDLISVDQQLSKLNVKENEKELSASELKKITNLKIKHSKLLKKRDDKANKMVIQKDSIICKQVALLKITTAKDKLVKLFNQDYAENEIEESLKRTK